MIESFAMKTPVIVNHLGPMPEVVEDSDGGFVYRNETELVQAMEALESDSKLRERLGNNGYQAYLKYWCEDSHIKQYMQSIDNIRSKGGQLT